MYTNQCDPVAVDDPSIKMISNHSIKPNPIKSDYIGSWAFPQFLSLIVKIAATQTKQKKLKRVHIQSHTNPIGNF